jgi:hypothetical protein
MLGPGGPLRTRVRLRDRVILITLSGQAAE